MRARHTGGSRHRRRGLGNITGCGEGWDRGDGQRSTATLSEYPETLHLLCAPETGQEERSKKPGSVSKVEMDCDCCHTGPRLCSFHREGMAHDVHRSPLPSLP